MRRLILIFVAVLLSGVAEARTYATACSGTENPISETGNWINGGTTGVVWTNVRKTPGLCFGTMPGNATGSAQFADSTATVSGPWGPDQDVSATAAVIAATTNTSIFEEVEIRLRTTITANTITGYEVNCSIANNGSIGNYMQLIKWNGALGSFTQLNGWAQHCVQGDVIRATISGTTSTSISVFRNGSLVGTTVDSSSPFLTGAPGVGMYLQGATGLNANYGLSAFSATDNITPKLWSNLLTDSRAVDWSTAGVQGGIPSAAWANCATAACNTLFGGTVTAASINAAITSCLANTVVRIPAGTFTLAAGTGNGILANNKSNCAIRGAGANSTFLIFNGFDNCLGTSALVCFRSTDINYFLQTANQANWTANFAEGTTVLALSSTTNLSVGSIIAVDQTDDTSDNSAIYVCYTPAGVCSTNGDNGGSLRANRSQQHMYTVTNIAGGNVTISPPLRMKNWALAKVPQAWWPTSPSSFIGLEDLSISGTTASANVELFNCNNCWVRGVRSVGPPIRSHVMLFQSGRATIRDNYFYKTGIGASVNYGVEAFPSGDSLVENNIFEQVQAPYPANATCTGCVWSFNFDLNNTFQNGSGQFIFQDQGATPHSSGNDFFLYEGNIGSGFNSDNFHGTHHLITNFRNYWNGYQKNNGTFTTQAAVPVESRSFSRFYNYLGNVLGNCTFHTVYQNNSNDAHAGNPIWEMGFGNGVPNDNNTPSTAMRWGNFDCINNANQFTASEVPSGLVGTQAPYTNPVPAPTLPASFYLSVQPAWWPSGKTWPPIGPDVVGGNVKYCVGGTMTGTYVLTAGQCPGGTATTLAGGRIVSNPAMDCYLTTLGGPPDGQGSALTFDASICYAAGVAPTVSLSPTSLTFAPLLVGLTSASQPVTLTNVGTATLSISSIVASAEYAQTNNCAATLAISTSCTINVTFTPSNAGTRPGTITITDNALGSPHIIPLTGTGVAPTIYRPTIFADSGNNPVTNPAFAYDANYVTFAVGGASNTLTYTVTYRGFPTTVGTPLNAALYIMSDAYNTLAALGGTQAEYSLNGGTTWNQLWVGPTHGAQNAPLIDGVILPAGQDFAQVQVRMGQASGCSPSPCTITQQTNEIWIQTGVVASQFSGGNLIVGGGLIQ